MPEPMILTSAYRHGITDEQILHAYRNTIRVVIGNDDLPLYIGADQTGRMLEIGVQRSDDRQDVIVHADDLREKFMR